MITPTGFHILIKPDEVEKQSAGGIVLAVNEKLEKHQTQTGELVAVGLLAWTDKGSGSPWAMIGDRVLYARHAGKFVTDEDTNIEYLILNDEDLIAVIKRGQ